MYECVGEGEGYCEVRENLGVIREVRVGGVCLRVGVGAVNKKEEKAV
jgi:hypothetical protein